MTGKAPCLIPIAIGTVSLEAGNAFALVERMLVITGGAEPMSNSRSSGMPGEIMKGTGWPAILFVEI